MKNTSLFRRFLSVVLVLAMIGSLLVPAASAETPKTVDEPTTRELELIPTDASALESHKLGEAEANDDSAPMEDHALSDVVRVSIVLDKASTLDAGFSTENITKNAEAMAYREGLRADQAAMTATIEKTIGSKLDVQWNMTLAANIISANVTYGKLDAIRAIEGVKEVFVENRYEPQTEVDADDPNNGSASYMIGSNITWANGYTGAGSKVAIIDTGADTLHLSFSGEGLEYAFQQTAAEKGMSYDAYVASLDLLTAEKIEAVKGQLNANIGSGAAAYRNTKVGYGYNYVDKRVDYIEHLNDSQGEHGSHVAGISTANRFVKVDGEFKPALETVGTQGVAPDAQLVVMKVFGNGGGAYDSDYMVAIEDAIVLGCDSANLSLGSGSAGFSFSGTYESVMNKLVENGMVVAMSAGNSYGWYSTPKNDNMYAYLYMDDVKYDTAGSPGSFTNSLTVASVDNMGSTGYPLLFGERNVFYSETSGYGNDPISTLAGQELEYVYFDNYGADGDGNSLLEPYADAIAGKVVLCSRGTSSFYQKVNAAAAAGAIACIIYNNQAGTINMNLQGVTTNIPAVSILQSDGNAIKAQSTAVTAEDNTVYYTGTMSISEEMVVQVPEVTDNVTVSAFSSYGMPGTLVLKPEILAPGGSIYSVWGANAGQSSPTTSHEDYEMMSGTSMASPQVAGMAAIMGQYIRENDLCAKTGLTARQLINSLLMSTAHPVYDSNGEYWPVFRVGAGLGNVADASAAQSFILMDEESTMFPDSAADGKVKAELGDDPDRTGEYSYKFTVNPMEGTKNFTLRTDLFLQDYAGNGGYGMLQYTGTTSISNVIGYFNISDPGYEVSYVVNGETYEDAFLIDADVNGDGETNELDAQAILDYVAGELAEEAAFDAEIADVDGDGKITTYDAHLILKSAATPVITADGPTEVTVNIKLTDTAKEVIDYLYNATYIEGYTYVDPVADEEGNMDVVHSIPILAFYGSWTDASMLDRTSVIDEAYGTGKLPYLANTNINYMTVKDATGATSVYMGNPYMVEDKFPVDRLAMSSNTTVQSFTTMSIRNIATQAFAVTDEDGKVLYSQASAGQRFAPYYYVNGGTWQNVATATYNVGKALSAAGVKEGDKVTVGYYALPEYYGVVNAKNNGTVATSGGLDNEGFKAILESGIVGDGAGIKYTVTVDDTAPTVTGALQDLITGNIVVKCSDNNYVAYVAVTNKSGNKVYFETVPEQTEPGETLEVPLTIEESLPSEVTLLVGDYAGNEVAFKVNLGGGAQEDNSGLMIGFVTEKTTAAPGAGNRAWQIDKDALWYNYSAGTYEGLGVYANMGFGVAAAEYAGGYVFMAGTDGWFYAAELGALDEATRVGAYEGTVYDMAYNYKAKTMYVLGDENTIYSMNLTTGALTPAYHVTAGTNAVVNKMAIDDNGTFYLGTYGSTSAASLYKFAAPEPEVEEEDEELGELVYEFGFETDVEEEGWTFVDKDGDGKNWDVVTDTPKEGANCIKSVSYESGASYNPDNWAISCPIDLSAYDEATLSVWLKNYSSSWVEPVALYAGTSADPEAMTKLGDDIVPGTAWEQATADLSDFAGEESVYVAIRHYNSYDNFRIYADLIGVYGKVVETEPEEPVVEAVEVTAEAVGVMGVYNYSYGGAMAWDHMNGVLYLASNYNTTQDYDHYLWVVDTKTGAASRANQTQGTGNTSSNASARLYGCVNGLFIVPGTAAVVEPTDVATELIVEPAEINMFKGQTREIKTAVMPWTLTNKDVTFTSSDETVATVNDRGTVTSVGVGTATVTVTTVATAENGEPLTATVTVTVSEPPAAELRGVIWDEEGKGQAASFNSNDTENWTAEAEVGQLRWGALVGDMVYGSTDDTMYGFDADTYELETYGGIVSMWIPSDACELPQDIRDAFAAMGYSVGSVIGPNNGGTYLSMMDPAAGSILYFDLSDTLFANDPMATIASAGRGVYDGETTDNDAPMFYVMTESGALYRFTMNHSGSVMWDLIGETGLDLTGVSDSTNSVWASSVYDAENEFLYVSLYNGADDNAHLYAIDVNDTSRVGETGTFREKVWPVTGLYEYTPATDLVLKVSPSELTMFEGDTAELKIKVKLGETNEYTVAIADPTICSFEDGVVTGLKEGETTITVTTVDANEAGEHLTAEVPVTVKALTSIDGFIKAQVSDANGNRVAKLNLAELSAAKKGVDVPYAGAAGGSAGDVYVLSDNNKVISIDLETGEVGDFPYDATYFPQYPGSDFANFPENGATGEAAELATAKTLMTIPSAGYVTTTQLTGWNLSSYVGTPVAIAFYGMEESSGTNYYEYLILNDAGDLYFMAIDYMTGSRTQPSLITSTGIAASDATAMSMAYYQDLGYETGEPTVIASGAIIADNVTKDFYYVDFMTEDFEIGKFGTLDVDNIVGLYGSFDDIANDGTEPVEPEPEIVIDGDVYAGFYFETEDDVNEWTMVDADNDGYGWEWSYNTGSWFSGTPDYSTWAYEGTGCIVSASYINTADALTPDNWAISPAVDMTAATGAKAISLYAAGLDPSYPADHFAVYAGTTPNPSDMIQVIGESVATADYVKYAAILPEELANASVLYFAVRHFNISDMYILKVDKVEVLMNATGETPNPDPDPELPEGVIAGYYFESAASLNEWTITSDGDSNWIWSGNNLGAYDYTPYAHQGSGFLMSYSYVDYQGAFQADNWAISPAVELPEGECAVSFYATNANAEYPEPFSVYVGTSANVDDMVLLQANITPTTGHDGWTHYSYDLSSYAGQTVYLAFYDYNYDGYEIWIDQVEFLGETEPTSVDSLKNVPAKTGKALPLTTAADLGLGVANMAYSAETAKVEMTKLGEVTNAVVGGTNAIKAGLSREPMKLPVDDTTVAEGNVKIDLSEDVDVTNGLINVTYNADELTFASVDSALAYKAIHHEIQEPAEGEEPALRTGVITIAYAAAEEIAAETVLATLNFTYTDADLDTTVVVTTLERNDDVAVEEDSLVIHVGEPKVYNLVSSLKDGDEVVIVNNGFNKALSCETASEKYLAGKDVAPEDGVLVNPDADTVWTVRVTDDGVKFENAEGETLTATLDSSNKTGLGLGEDHNLWILEATNAAKTFYVKSSDVTYNGNPQYLEYYSSKDYFSVYGLQTGKENMYTIQFYANREDEHDCQIGQFTDLEQYPYGTVEHDAIEWAFTHGYTAGVSETEWAPEMIVNRAQAMTFLYAVNGKPTDFEMPDASFPDVPEDEWFYKPVMWALSLQMTAGFPDGNFYPYTDVTRAQMLQFFYAAEGKPPVTIENPYTDIDDDAWYKDAALWAYEKGLEKGENGEFASDTPCPRVTVVLYLYRYYTGNGLIAD